MYSIVLIDDERWMLEQMWRILEWGSLDCKIAGEFTDAQKALAEIARLAPDIILCDISMPSMSGLDFLDELRKRKIDTEVIFISGYNRFEYAQKAVNLGAFGYLLKPVDKKEFENMIKRCLIRCGNKDSGLKQKASEEKKDSEENRGIVKKVKEYLSEHYAEDVNLESVADRVGLHPSYLSSLFKKEESTTFLNYLTNIRLEEAKRLLREGKKVHYISRSVGYRSEQYFSSVFKKRTGQSPAEYREKYLEISISNR